MGLTSGVQKYTDAIESVRPPVFRWKTGGDEGEILIGKIKLAHALSQMGNLDQPELPECAFLIETDGIICQAVNLGGTIHAIDPLWFFDDTDLIFEPIESHKITVRGEPCLIRYLPVQDSAESHWREAVVEDYATLEPKQENLTAAVSHFTESTNNSTARRTRFLRTLRNSGLSSPARYSKTKKLSGYFVPIQRIRMTKILTPYSLLQSNGALNTEILNILMMMTTTRLAKMIPTSRIFPSTPP